MAGDGGLEREMSGNKFLGDPVTVYMTFSTSPLLSNALKGPWILLPKPSLTLSFRLSASFQLIFCF